MHIFILFLKVRVTLAQLKPVCDFSVGVGNHVIYNNSPKFIIISPKFIIICLLMIPLTCDPSLLSRGKSQNSPDAIGSHTKTADSIYIDI